MGDIMDNQIAWLAEKFSSMLKDDARQRFLSSLKHTPEYVVKVFAHDMDQMLMEYTFAKGGVAVANSLDSNDDAYTSLAKVVVKYMTDEFLKEELTEIA